MGPPCTFQVLWLSETHHQHKAMNTQSHKSPEAAFSRGADRNGWQPLASWAGGTGFFVILRFHVLADVSRIPCVIVLVHIATRKFCSNCYEWLKFKKQFVTTALPIARSCSSSLTRDWSFSLQVEMLLRELHMGLRGVRSHLHVKQKAN